MRWRHGWQALSQRAAARRGRAEVRSQAGSPGASRRAQARNPKRDLPIAIIGSLTLATVLYVLVRRPARQCRSRNNVVRVG